MGEDHPTGILPECLEKFNHLERTMEPIAQIASISTDLKLLLQEFKNMNGALKTTKSNVDEHLKESAPYRTKVEQLWAGVHFVKWMIMLLFGTGLLVQIVLKVAK